MENEEKRRIKIMRTHYGKMKSIFAKLDNQLGANKAAMAKKKHDKENAKKENK